MPTGGRDTYFLRGQHPMVDADSLEEALVDILSYWAHRPSLVVHEMGNLVLEMNLHDKLVVVEIVDPDVLDRFRGPEGPAAVISHLVGLLGMDPADAASLLGNVTSTRAVVDTLRIPGEPYAWKPDADKVPEEVMPREAPILLNALLRAADEEAARGVRRRRTPEGEELLRAAVRMAAIRGWSVTKLAREIKIPISTLRDVKTRMDREIKGAEEFRKRPARTRLTADQTTLIRRGLATWGDNAAEVARRLGVPERTVRDVRARDVAGRPVPTAEAPRAVRHYTDRDRKAFLKKLERNSPSEAARLVGIPERTGRQWQRDARFHRGPFAKRRGPKGGGRR
jgi:DNA-directed RNA polymerase specialized sigma24 family protein